MLEHISKPVATLFWSILGFLAGYSGVAMFDDFDSQFSGLLIIITIPVGMICLAVQNLLGASYEFMLFTAVLVWASGAIGVSYKKFTFIVWAPAAITIFYLMHHYWHGTEFFSIPTLIEFGITMVISAVVWLARDPLMMFFMDIIGY
ncbi:hypothetical protein TeGR_g5672 [Tetraparma gracilis]|uniref:Uncharacterized protein n=1 Tax=Tetraparma gracilis TaxID=2962635 RepID=A0ABQ6MS95_9STRA|nr:hypothetical protein TeGR_g5672 [Tetraparma gracilis]